MDPDNEQEQASYVDGQMMINAGFLTRFLWAPWDGRKNAKGDYIGPAFLSTTTLVALILEFFWSFVLGFAVVSARFYTTLGSGSNGLQDGFFIGAVAASIWLLAWIWSTDYNLKRHLNWGITVAYLFKFRYNSNMLDTDYEGPQMKPTGTTQGPDYGLLAFILYGGMQLAGAALAGALLLAFSLGNIPNPTAAGLNTVAGSAITASEGFPALAGLALDKATPGLVWFVEFFGVMLIVLANVYNDQRHQDKNNNAGDARENEYDNHVRTGVITALTILAVTTMLYPLGSYSFGPVPYFAGLVAVGTTTASSVTEFAGNSPQTRLIDWAHYLFTPLAGGFAGGVVAFLVSLLLEIRPRRSRMSGGMRIMQRQQYRSVQTPLTQSLLNKKGLRARPNGNAHLNVKAFN